MFWYVPCSYLCLATNSPPRDFLLPQMFRGTTYDRPAQVQDRINKPVILSEAKNLQSFLLRGGPAREDNRDGSLPLNMTGFIFVSRREFRVAPFPAPVNV